MATNCYEYVSTLARCGSLSKAAKELYITQPALTKYINRLEENLGIRLFDRTCTPIRPTYAGEKYLEKANLILEIERSLETELRALSTTDVGKLNVGFPSEMGSAILPYLIPEFYYRYPRIELQIKEGTNDFLYEELLADRLDLVVTTDTPGQQPDMDHVADLYKDDVLLAVPRSHPIAQAYDLTDNSPSTPYYLPPEQLNGAPLIMLSARQGMGKIARQFLTKYSIHPSSIFETSKNETALRLASSGMGCVFTLVRTTTRISLLHPMAFFSIEDPVRTRQCCIKSKPGAALPKASERFVALLTELILTEPGLKRPTCQLLHRNPVRQFLPK